MVAAAAVLAFSATGGGVFAEKNKFCEYPPRGPLDRTVCRARGGPWGARPPARTHTHASRGEYEFIMSYEYDGNSLRSRRPTKYAFYACALKTGTVRPSGDYRLDGHLSRFPLVTGVYRVCTDVNVVVITLCDPCGHVEITARSPRRRKFIRNFDLFS